MGVQHLFYLVEDVGGNAFGIAIGRHRCNAPGAVKIGIPSERIVSSLIPPRVDSGIVTGDSDGQKDGWFVTAFVRTVIGGNAELKISNEESDVRVDGMVH